MKDLIKTLIIAVLCGLAVFVTFRWISFLLLVLFGGGHSFQYALFSILICGLGLICSLIYLIKTKAKLPKSRIAIRCEFAFIFIAASLIPYSCEDTNVVPSYKFSGGVIVKHYHHQTSLLSRSGKELVPPGDYNYIAKIFVEETGKDCFMTCEQNYSKQKMYLRLYDQGVLISQYNVFYTKHNSDECIYGTLFDFINDYIGQAVHHYRGYLDELYVMDYECHTYEKSEKFDDDESSNSNESKEPVYNSEKSDSKSGSSHSYEPEYITRDEWVPCFACNGTGNCSACNGRGQYPITNYYGEVLKIENCTVCFGSGKCQICYGSRGQYEKRTYQTR